LIEVERIDKLGDLIKFIISLMKPKGLIEEILQFGTDLRQNCKKLKSKDHSVKGAAMQVFNYNLAQGSD
jgi:hypothetical protein